MRHAQFLVHSEILRLCTPACLYVAVSIICYITSMMPACYLNIGFRKCVWLQLSQVITIYFSITIIYFKLHVAIRVFYMQPNCSISNAKALSLSASSGYLHRSSESPNTPPIGILQVKRYKSTI
jgi:hypothetical protein